MKNFLQNLLIALSLCLCGLIAYQWVRETRTHQRLQQLTNQLQDQREANQNLEGQLKRSEAEVRRLEELRAELNETIRSNRVERAKLAKELDGAQVEIERLKRQVEAYKDAVDQANAAITRQNEEVKKQNEDLKRLAEERNEMVVKFNKLAGDYNDLVKKWNEMQEKLAAESAAQAQAEAAKKK